tara:strand:+ start:1028 stop:1309 length:282 start_codon:yes stop_codon:yes gene_type:complete
LNCGKQTTTLKKIEIMTDYKINYNPLNNLDIIDLEVVKSYDRRNKDLANYNLVKYYGKEMLMTKEECDRIDDNNRVLRNEDLKFMKYLNGVTK